MARKTKTSKRATSNTSKVILKGKNMKRPEDTKGEIKTWLTEHMDEGKRLRLESLTKKECAIPFLVHTVLSAKGDSWKQLLPKDMATHMAIKTYLSRYGMQTITTHGNAMYANQGKENPAVWMLWELSQRQGSGFHRTHVLDPDVQGRGCKGYKIRREFYDAVREVGMKLPAFTHSVHTYKTPQEKIAAKKVKSAAEGKSRKARKAA